MAKMGRSFDKRKFLFVLLSRFGDKDLQTKKRKR